MWNKKADIKNTRIHSYLIDPSQHLVAVSGLECKLADKKQRKYNEAQRTKKKELISINKEVKNIYIIITHQIKREKQIWQEYLQKILTSLIIHQEHIDSKRTIIVRRFQTINHLSK